MPSVCTAVSGYFLFGPAQSCLNGLTIILFYEFHTCSFIHAYATCIQISFMHGCIISLIFNCTKSVIHNVSKSEMLPIMYISSGRSHQNSRLPMSLHFPSVFSSVGRYRIEVIDGISFSYVGRYPIEVIDSCHTPIFDLRCH